MPTACIGKPKGFPTFTLYFHFHSWNVLKGKEAEEEEVLLSIFVGSFIQKPTLPKHSFALLFPR